MVYGIRRFNAAFTRALLILIIIIVIIIILILIIIITSQETIDYTLMSKKI